MELKIGDRVLAQFNFSSEWLPGVIVRVNPGKTYHVMWFNRAQEDFVSQERIKIDENYYQWQVYAKDNPAPPAPSRFTRPELPWFEVWAVEIAICIIGIVVLIGLTCIIKRFKYR